MISIVTAYYNRKQLFINTLESIRNQNYAGDFEVIAVDDGSKEDERLEDLPSIYPFLKVIYLSPRDKWYKNSCIPFNIGFRAAKGDKIIIQNPECYHFSPILQDVEQHLSANTYLSFGCFSLDKEATEMVRTGDLREIIPQIIKVHNHIFKMDGLNGWYNHSVFRPEGYHFCTAIRREDLIDLGGFDERYAHGVGEDDIEFIHRIRLKGLNIIFRDDIFVLHQNHYNIDYTDMGKISAEKEDLYRHNRKIFSNVTKPSYYWRTGYLLGQENYCSSTESIVQRDYKVLITAAMEQIIRNRFARKIALKFLTILSKII